jgi:hypothetical protein
MDRQAVGGHGGGDLRHRRLKIAIGRRRPGRVRTRARRAAARRSPVRGSAGCRSERGRRWGVTTRALGEHDPGGEPDARTRPASGQELGFRRGAGPGGEAQRSAGARSGADGPAQALGGGREVRAGGHRGWADRRRDSRCTPLLSRPGCSERRVSRRGVGGAPQAGANKGVGRMHHGLGLSSMVFVTRQHDGT